MNSLAKFSDMNSLSFDGMVEAIFSNSIKYTRDMLYCAYMANCESKGIEPIITNTAQMGDLLDEMPQELFNSIVSKFTESKLFGKPLLPVSDKKKE